MVIYILTLPGRHDWEFRAVFQWLSKVITRLLLLRLVVIDLKILRQFFKQWEAKSIAPCTCDFSCALSKLLVISRDQFCFVLLVLFSVFNLWPSHVFLKQKKPDMLRWHRGQRVEHTTSSWNPLRNILNNSHSQVKPCLPPVLWDMVCKHVLWKTSFNTSWI